MISRASVRQQITKPPTKRKSKSKSKSGWIKKAIEQPGALRAKLKVKPGKKITQAQLKKALRSKNPTTRRQANLAKTLKSLRKKRKANV